MQDEEQEPDEAVFDGPQPEPEVLAERPPELDAEPEAAPDIHPPDPPLEATYEPFDPTEVAGSSVPPPQEPFPPSFLPASGEDDLPAPEDLPFDPRWREPFEGLLFLGALSKSFTWGGHRFKIRTLLMSELLEITLLQRPYAETMAAIKAMQAATVAACVEAVDGRPLVVLPLTMEERDTMVANRFQYVLNHWFAPTVDRVYTEYIELEAYVFKVLEALGNSPG